MHKERRIYWGSISSQFKKKHLESTEAREASENENSVDPVFQDFLFYIWENILHKKVRHYCFLYWPQETTCCKYAKQHSYFILCEFKLLHVQNTRYIIVMIGLNQRIPLRAFFSENQ